MNNEETIDIEEDISGTAKVVLPDDPEPEAIEYEE